MCVGLEQSHAQCGHLKSWAIGTRCFNAIQSGNDCLREQCSSISGETVSLPLCLNCYREKEEAICQAADKVYQRIIEHSVKIKRELENPGLDMMERFVLKDRLSQAVEAQRGNRTVRALMLYEFRKSQGVWGDG